MIEVASSVEVGRPAEEAFAFVADAENNPRWQRGMRSCKWITDPPIRVGSAYEQEARFLGRTITSTFEVTDLQPGRSITIATIRSTFPIEVTRTADPIDDHRAHVRALVRGDPSGIFGVAAPLLRRLVQRSVRADYGRLQRLLARPDR
jgi:uncharacterized membrane protein